MPFTHSEGNAVKPQIFFFINIQFVKIQIHIHSYVN